MRRGIARAPLVLALAFLPLACGGRAATPAPVAAAGAAKPADPSAALLGHWLWTAELDGEAYAGAMELTRATDGSWQARVVDNSMGELPVRGVKVEGTSLTVNVEARGDTASVVAALQPDGTVTGKLLAAGGEGTFSARKG